MENKIILKNVRLSYANLREPYEEGGKLNCKFLLDKETQADQIAKVKKAIDTVIKEEYKVDRLPAGKVCLQDGDDYGKPGFEGKMFVSAGNDSVQILSRKREVIHPADADTHPDEPYSGCYVNASISLWHHKGSTEKQYGRRVNASLNGVQFASHGEAFGRGRVDTTNDFDDIDDSDDMAAWDE